jgi:hypothetical protein
MPTITPTTTVPVYLDGLSGAERRILQSNGGQPWQLRQLTPEAVAEAKEVLAEARQAFKFGGLGRWFTDETTSSKLAKSGVATRGVTLLSADLAAEVWAEIEQHEREALARAFGVSVEFLSVIVGLNLCPFATEGCKRACTTSESINAIQPSARRSRLVRTLMHLLRPDLAFALTGNGLRKLKAKYGDDCRWRVNVSDDVRWERVAPGLFEIGVKGYAYTKYPPARRKAFDGLRIVYSASERTTDEQIHTMVKNGHNVAVVFAVATKDLPTTWQGIEVVNGDKTDDLYSHKPATIVGLSIKGRNNDIKEGAEEHGFARPV